MQQHLRPGQADDVAQIGAIYRESSIAALGAHARSDAVEAAAAGRLAMWSPLLRPATNSALLVFDDAGIDGFVSVAADAEGA